MSDERRTASRTSRVDQARACLGIGAALGAVAGHAAGKVGVATVMALTLLQWLNLRWGRRDSAFRKAGKERYALPTVEPSSRGAASVAFTRTTVTRAEPLFLLEELALVGMGLWGLVLSCWALGLPVHPLMYSAMLLLVGLVVLLQLAPQLRVRHAPAPKRPIARPSSQRLH